MSCVSFPLLESSPVSHTPTATFELPVGKGYSNSPSQSRRDNPLHHPFVVQSVFLFVGQTKYQQQFFVMRGNRKWRLLHLPQIPCPLQWSTRPQWRYSPVFPLFLYVSQSCHPSHGQLGLRIFRLQSWTLHPYSEFQAEKNVSSPDVGWGMSSLVKISTWTVDFLWVNTVNPTSISPNFHLALWMFRCVSQCFGLL